MDQGNIYYQPQSFGMELIGEVDFDNASYGFDIVAVWKLYDGTLVWGADAGCSCPSPFDRMLPTSLQPITTLEAHLRERGRGEVTFEGAGLLEKVWSHS